MSDSPLLLTVRCEQRLDFPINANVLYQHRESLPLFPSFYFTHFVPFCTYIKGQVTRVLSIS